MESRSPRQARDYYRDIVLESEDRVRTLPSSSYRREAADSINLPYAQGDRALQLQGPLPEEGHLL